MFVGGAMCRRFQVPIETGELVVVNGHFHVKPLLNLLSEDGLLSKLEFADIHWSRSHKQVDYDTLYQYREGVLRKAFSRFTDVAVLDDFAAAHSWFADYGLFMAIKNVQGERSWQQWDEPLRLRDPDALTRMQKELADDIRYHAFVQYQFQRQWRALHDYASEKGIRIIGDIPIYVALDSADVWSNPEMFQLDEHFAPTEIAGCPPDGFSAEGQVWGNPLYDWEAIAKTAFQWWIQRLENTFDLYDMVRIDHFRGLESYYAIPYGSENAKVKGYMKCTPCLKNAPAKPRRKGIYKAVTLY
jgi:4-alpha-glucanotransferase